MLFLRFLLIAVGMGLFGGASGVIAYDIYIAAQLRRLLGRKSQGGGTEAGRTRLALYRQSGGNWRASLPCWGSPRFCWDRASSVSAFSQTQRRTASG